MCVCVSCVIMSVHVCVCVERKEDEIWWTAKVWLCSNCITLYRPTTLDPVQLTKAKGYCSGWQTMRSTLRIRGAAVVISLFPSSSLSLCPNPVASSFRMQKALSRRSNFTLLMENRGQWKNCYIQHNKAQAKPQRDSWQISFHNPSRVPTKVTVAPCYCSLWRETVFSRACTPSSESVSLYSKMSLNFH